MTDITFDPSRLVDDPYPTYARLRDEAPLTWHDTTGLWLVARHHDVDRLLRDRRLGRVFVPYEPRERFAPWNLLNEHSLLELEPPEHTRLRRLAARPFTPRRIAGLRGRIVELTDELLDRVDPTGFDLMTEFAELLPVEVIAELLGVPRELRGPLRPWSNRIVALYELDHDDRTAQAAIDAAAEFTAMLDELIAWRRDAPGDDLLSALVHADVDGDALSRDELVATAALLLNAGHEASVNVIGNGVVALLERRARLAELRDAADADAMADAVEELIRFDSPLSLFQRTVFEPVEVVGRVLEPGERVGLLLGSANRDEEAFDRADTLKLRRSPNPHVGFGAGIHYCLGAPLARLEIAVALERLLARSDVIELVDAPTRRASFQFRGYRRVPVRMVAA
ncbi:MAG: cytochrome P450 [Actinobacteria bacterium]|nr:cytochrome P450 [Actinomycetota bacterium]